MNKVMNRVDQTKDKTMRWIIFFMFLFFWVIRSIPAKNIDLMIRYWDELFYFGYAKSFAAEGIFSVRNLPMPFNNVIYSVLIVPIILLLQGTKWVIPTICVCNAALICSSIFPIYKLTKEIIHRKSIQLIVVFLSMTLPIYLICLNILIESLFIPVSFWTFYVVYKYFATPVGKRWKYAIAEGALLALLYAIKGIGAFTLLAFAFTAIVEMVFLLLSEKRVGAIKLPMLDAIISGVTFVVLFVLNMAVVGLFMYPVEKDSQASAGLIFANGFSHLTNWAEVKYFIYAILLSLTVTVLAMGVFPVIMPVAYNKGLNKETKMYMIFSEAVVLINCILVAFTIIICESPFEVAPVHHYRYCEHFVVNFYILFAAIFFNKSSQDEEISVREKMKLLALSIIFCILMVMIFQFCVNGVNWGNYGLSDLNWLDNKFKGLSNFFHKQFSLWTFRITIVAAVVIVTICFLKKKLRKIAIILVFAVMSVYTICTNAIYTKVYVSIVQDVKMEHQIPEAIAMDKYLKTLDGNVLMVTQLDHSRSSILFDSYIYETSYLTTRDLLFSIADENGEIDLTQKCIRAMYPNKEFYEYSNLDKVDYVLTDGCVEFNPDQAEHVDVPGAKRIHLYKLKNTHRFKPLLSDVSFFPTNVGACKTSEYGLCGLRSEGTQDEGFTTSKESKDGVFLYGPYEPITKGTYEIELYYSYDGKDLNGKKIGTTDISVKGGKKVLKKEKLFAKDNVIKYTVEVKKDFENAEMRIFTKHAGLTFEKVKITKIAE